MAMNYRRDWEEMAEFAKGYAGKTTRECIEAYAAKRGIVTHRAGNAFWGHVDEGNIRITEKDCLLYIV